MKSTFPRNKEPGQKIAYFSMEIGLRKNMPTYAGGLGVLAGDTLRSSADLGIPLIAVTLVSKKGHFYQDLDDQGRQIELPEEWDPSSLLAPLSQQVKIRLEGRDVRIRSWLYRLRSLTGGEVPVLFLDTDLEENSPGDREITHYHNKTLPLVLLTSLGKRVPPDHAYLTKPIKPSQMRKVLTDILPKTGILSVQPAQKTGMASRVNQPAPNSSLRILLAEDNISSQKVALQMLKKLGYKADVVANGIEALQSLERQHYDVVFMDVKMPVMDGIEATRIIRQRWPINGPKIIAITAYALEGDRVKCLEAGMDGYIAKPVQKEDLARTLKDLNRL